VKHIVDKVKEQQDTILWLTNEIKNLKNARASLNVGKRRCFI